jgi:hypothetical protein
MAIWLHDGIDASLKLKLIKVRASTRNRAGDCKRGASGADVM